MPIDPAVRDHKAWLGYLQPDGLVVSPAALVDAQVLLNRNSLPLQEQFRPFVEEVEREDNTIFVIRDFTTFACEFLRWPEQFLFGLNEARPLPESLSIPLPDSGITLTPSFAFKDPRSKNADNPWLLLVQTLPLATDLDTNQIDDESGWSASPARRFERLLREANVPIGLISNGERIKLIYAPRGENSGSLTFVVKEMAEVAGRPILAAFHMLLDQYCLLAAPSEARLPALLTRSREYQSRVSTTLAQQVLDALYEMLRGFQGANEQTNGELLRAVLAKNPDDVYAGMLAVLMRLVFLLFAEDRGLMPTSELYVRYYSIHGLFERLRTDHEQYPDTMNQRFGAWAQLLTLFRVVYQGCQHPQLQMPARHGHLFDPNRYPFLAGRSTVEAQLPLVSDGTIFRVLQKLIILDGERLSYRTLDVEEIGSVYQTVMGFRLEIAQGPSIAISGKRKHKGEVAAPTVINLNQLLSQNSNKRKEWLKEQTEQVISGEAEKALKTATTTDDLLAALERKIARNATPLAVPQGATILQPTDERRRSGSHYTPRSFTDPIVRTTLRPVLERLGHHPTPEQILDLKICDLAVGSAAFLVEACRQLGDVLVAAWRHHNDRPFVPPDETEELLARRMVAQRCLYGVDRNPMAVDLAKLSLWLATLAKDHPFTFLDHSIRCGDSLVGLTKKQIADFHWLPAQGRVLGQDLIEKRINGATRYRKEILDGGDFSSPQLKHEQLGLADEALDLVREAGDLVITAFFSADKDRARIQQRDELLVHFTESLRDINVSLDEVVSSLRSEPFPIKSFHWEIEFPEAFDRENGGFDAIISNPPFLGGGKISSTSGDTYLEWLKTIHEGTHGNADLVAHFFRRSFNLLRNGGCFGLIATNTIGQGDTRSTGLYWICTHDGIIYSARRRTKWPGQAAVIVSITHGAKQDYIGDIDLDGCKVQLITAYLFHTGVHENPEKLKANKDKTFNGAKIYGQGFLFDNGETGITTIDEMRSLIVSQPCNQERIFPYIGGEEVNDSPTQSPHRFVLSFADWPLCRNDIGRLWADADEVAQLNWLRQGIVPIDYPNPVAADYPDLLRIVEQKVKPERLKLRDTSDGIRLKEKWWLFGRSRPELYRAIQPLQRVLVNSQVSAHFAFALLPTSWIFAHTVNIFCIETFAGFAAIQSRVHEVWARFFSSSMKDDMRYTTSDCFETFPFPHGFELSVSLEQAGREYYEFRAELMIHNNEGLTKTYNRFHDPNEYSPDILRLRELHNAMDRAVLDAYGWNDIQTACTFLLDYEDEEDDNDSSKRRKKPWRYRWPDEIRDEVLARLLALNAQRAKEEQLSGAAANKQRSKPTAPKPDTKKNSKSNTSEGQGAFDF